MIKTSHSNPAIAILLRLCKEVDDERRIEAEKAEKSKKKSDEEAA